MSYLLRLLSVCLASFFLLHLAVSLLVLAVAPLADRLAERMRPAAGARLLFLLRLLPLTLSLAVVLGFCVPSYLRFEQDASESIGLLCLLLAAAGLALLAAAALRLSSTVTLARSIPSDDTLAAPHPLFALVGFLRPRLVVAARVRQALTPNQLEAALLHEEAHRQSHDNLKRLAMAAAPGILPLHATFRTLEQRWSRLAEWAADDAAVAAQPLRALALAEALVRVARLSATHTLPGISALVDSRDDLGERIERLLQTPAPVVRSTPRPRALALSVAALALVLFLIPHQGLLYAVHSATEQLVH
jgi:Zn-dependent protease with chaperone function